MTSDLAAVCKRMAQEATELESEAKRVKDAFPLTGRSLDRRAADLRAALAAIREQEAQWDRARSGECIGFYEREFYPLSNFSSFRLLWRSLDFDTSEAAYHWEKFPDHPVIRQQIMSASSAHEAFKLAGRERPNRRADWDEVKVPIMLDILRAKASQHEYVRRKLLQTGNRLLVEDSWRDDFWGWGQKRDGLNQLGKLWMQVRQELRAALAPAPAAEGE